MNQGKNEKGHFQTSSLRFDSFGRNFTRNWSKKVKYAIKNKTDI